MASMLAPSFDRSTSRWVCAGEMSSNLEIPESRYLLLTRWFQRAIFACTPSFAELPFGTLREFEFRNTLTLSACSVVPNQQ